MTGLDIAYAIDNFQHQSKQVLMRLIRQGQAGSLESEEGSVVNVLANIHRLDAKSKQEVIQYLADEIARGR